MHQILIFKQRDFFYFSLCTLLNTASSVPLRFHCVGGCWDQTQDYCDFFALAVRRSNNSATSHPHSARSHPHIQPHNYIFLDSRLKFLTEICSLYYCKNYENIEEGKNVNASLRARSIRSRARSRCMSDLLA
jgi:hypothetical protein